MPQFISLEISAQQVVELMVEDGNFAAEFWRELASGINKGSIKDDAADIAAGMSSLEAAYISSQFEDLAEAMKSGFNMANLEQI